MRKLGLKMKPLACDLAHAGMPMNCMESSSLCSQVEPGNETCILAACGDGSLSIWDVRKLGPKMKPLAETRHYKTCNSAYFSPTGALPALVHQQVCLLLCSCTLLQLCSSAVDAAVGRLCMLWLWGPHCSTGVVLPKCQVTVLLSQVRAGPCGANNGWHAGSMKVVSTSRDDTLRVWDGKDKLAQVVSCKHNNNTGEPCWMAIRGPGSQLQAHLGSARLHCQALPFAACTTAIHMSSALLGKPCQSWLHSGCPAKQCVPERAVWLQGAGWSPSEPALGRPGTASCAAT